jgi:hypothetical protein
MKYHDFWAYPLGLAFVYCLVALAMWQTNPGDWNDAARILWIIWSVAWGEALRIRIRKDTLCDAS